MHIDEKTKVPLFAVLASVPIIFGGILWLTSIDSKASGAQEELKGVKDMLRDVRERTIRIEQKLTDKGDKWIK